MQYRFTHFFVFLIAALLANFWSHTLFSQTSIPPIVPLSPNAAEFSKYGTFPVSMVSGTPEINLPIYEIISGKLSLPITLSYHASGIKVNQFATWAGLGWSLNAGGVISRTVRGMPDEKNNVGWIDQSLSLSEIEESNDWELVKNFANNKTDSHPDFFTYNMPTKSGKFIYQKSTSAFKPIPFKPILIKPLTAPISNTYLIIDDDGSKYYFEEKELYTNDNFGLEQYVQSWYLTKIISYDDVDTITLNYDLYTGGSQVQPEERSESETRSYVRVVGDPNFIDQGVSTSVSYTYHSNLVLTEIIFRQGKVVFHSNTPRTDYRGNSLDGITIYHKQADEDVAIYHYAFDYDYFSPGQPSTNEDDRLKLISFSKTDINTSVSQTHAFDYNSISPPSTRSYAQDYWGYYNGHNSNGGLLQNVPPSYVELIRQYGQIPVGSANRNPSDSHIMAGMLEKITYPTGGYTVFKYAPNKFKSDYSNIDPSYPLQSLKVNGIGRHQIATQSKTFQLPENVFSNTGTIKITFSPSSNPGAFDVAQMITLKDITNAPTNQVIRRWEHTGDQTVELKIDDGYEFEKDHLYEITGVVDDITSSYVEIKVTCQVVISQTLIKSGGGIRIENITSYEHDNTLLLKEVYQYGENGDGIGKILQTDADLTSNYYVRRFQYSPCLGAPFPCASCVQVYKDYVVYVSASNHQQISFGGAPVIYQYVTKLSYGNGVPNGKTLYQFDITRDISSIYNPTALGGRDNIIDNSFRTGQLKFETTYKYNAQQEKYSIVSQQETQYSNPTSEYVQGLGIWKKITYTTPNDALCILYDDPLQNRMQVIRDFGWRRYDIALGHSQLTRTIEKQYSDDGKYIQVIKNYTYSPFNQVYPAEISTLDSKGDQKIERMKYPGDHQASDENKTILDKMVVLNILSTPYWQASYKNNKLLNYSRTIYDNTWNTNLNAIWVKNKDQYTNLSGLKKVGFVLYDQYDNTGNPLSFHTQQKIPVTYLWGYNYSYPIAEIKNATYDEVETALGGSAIVEELAQSIMLSQTQMAKVNLLRSQLSNAMITTFTYSPLKGMLSQTDAAGVATYFTYDDLGRLKLIKDQNQAIRKQYIYHYKSSN